MLLYVVCMHLHVYREKEEREIYAIYRFKDHKVRSG